MHSNRASGNRILDLPDSPRFRGVEIRADRLLGIVVLVTTVIAFAAHAQTYDPALFTVLGQSCYCMCPAGDIPFSFRISYNGEALAAPPSDIYMTIECPGGDLPLCPGEEWDKPSYHVLDYNPGTPDHERRYYWSFQGSGWCLDAKISLHMIDDLTPFFEEDIILRSFDINWDFVADHRDKNIIDKNIGMDIPQYDINCNGIVDWEDAWWMLIISLNHDGHSCSQPISTEESTWGSIKSIYR